MAAESVSVAVEHGPWPGLKRPEVLRRIHAMIDALQLKNVEASFVLTDDKRVHQLNKVYRGIDKTTDVLAFAMQEGELSELAGGVLGDVIVSVPTAEKQADERGAPVLDEVTMLLAHGLLHLLGWDHDTPAKDRRMRAETERLCAAAASRGPQKSAPRSKGRAKPAISRNPTAAPVTKRRTKK